MLLSNRVSSRENEMKRCVEILCLVSGFVIWFCVLYGLAFNSLRKREPGALR